MELQSMGLGVVYIFLGVIVLLASKLIKDLATPFRLDEELTLKDNPAFGLVVAGYFAGSLGQARCRPVSSTAINRPD